MLSKGNSFHGEEPFHKLPSLFSFRFEKPGQSPARNDSRFFNCPGSSEHIGDLPDGTIRLHLFEAEWQWSPSSRLASTKLFENGSSEINYSHPLLEPLQWSSRFSCPSSGFQVRVNLSSSRFFRFHFSSPQDYFSTNVGDSREFQDAEKGWN